VDFSFGAFLAAGDFFSAFSALAYPGESEAVSH
jgi:hypothetical protein